jgi:hypothetical protein
MSDLTPETIAHLRELDAARTQGEWSSEPIGSEGFHVFGPEGSRAPLKGRARVAACTWQDWDEADADAEFIAMTANHMGALLDAAEERDEYRERFRNQMNAATDTLAEVSRLRAELADAAVLVKGAESAARILYAALTETRAQIERVTALAAKWDEDRALYPTNSDSRAVPAAVAVRLCTEELRAALTPATQREEGE